MIIKVRGEIEDLKSLGGKIVCLGRIVGSQGLEGLARLKSYTAKPEDIGAYGPLVDKKHNYRFNISVVRLSKKGVVAQIEGISSRTELEKFYGLDLYVDRSVLPELKDEEFYYSDLVGLLVNDIDGNFIFVPKSPFFASAKIYPFFILILAPNFFSPKR